MSNAFDEERLGDFSESLLRNLGVKPKPKPKYPRWYWVLGVPIVAVAFAGLLVLNAWAAAWLWWWFAVPLGMPMLSMAHALGVSVLAHFLTSRSMATAGLARDKSTKAKVAVLLAPIVTPLMAVAIGYAAHWIMGA